MIKESSARPDKILLQEANFMAKIQKRKNEEKEDEKEDEKDKEVRS